MIEKERSRAAGDPRREAGLWTSKLEQIERKRSGYQDLAAEGLITLDELRSKLGALEKEHSVAKAELQAILQRKEKIATLERDAEFILDSYSSIVPGRMESLGPEERHRIYKLLKSAARLQREDERDVCHFYTASGEEE